MTALDVRKVNDMRVTGHIPLRFLHSAGVNFTLPILKKSVSPTLFPFSLKKLNPRADRNGNEKFHHR